MHERAQQARLARMRRIATGLLALMAVVYVVAHVFAGRHVAIGFVGAFAEAAMVGAIADWFAVTALFRHPLGLPIPHTAIIPTNKERIGESLGNFLEENFMNYEVVHAELQRIDFSGSASHWLAQPDNARSVAGQVVGAVPALLNMVDDEEGARFLREALAGSLEGIKLAPLLSQLLSVLVAGGQHHLLLERMLGIVARALEAHRPYIRQKVHEHSPRWLPRAIDEKFYERLMEGVQNTLEEIRSEDSEWRARFQQATEELIDKLATSPDYEVRLQSLLSDSLGHPLFRDYAAQVWSDIRQRLLADAASADSRLSAHLAKALTAFSDALQRNPAIQQRINDHLRTFLAQTIVARRELIIALVRRVIQSWDAETISRKFELHVGRDLQFIRINGTLVGGLVGVLLHTISRVF